MRVNVLRKLKRVRGPGNLVHGFTERKGDYGGREATTYCGVPIWAQDTGLHEAYQVVRYAPITCLYCLTGRLV